VRQLYHPNFIVIGGGVSGLKAALDLANAGFQVSLLEARNRLGGRIYTSHAKDGLTPIELGASYWEGINSNPFYQHYFSENKQALKAHAVRLDEKKSTFITIDRLPSEDNILDYYHLAKEKLDKAETLGASKTFQQYIDELSLSNLTPIARHWTRRFLENALQHHCTPLTLGGFPSFIRESIIDDLEKWNDEDADFCFVQNGYRKVIEQLQQECLAAGVEIVLNSPVLKIRDNGLQGVQIETAHEIRQATKVISTLPIGVLKSEANQLFSPPLSPEKLQALSCIGVHDATRVILEFAGEPFWDNWDGPYLYLDSLNSPTLLEFRNAYPLCQKAILLTGKYSDLARFLYTKYPLDKSLAESQLIEKILQDLQTAFPQKKVPSPIHTTVYCWTADPFAKGAYPYRTVEITETVQLALERKEGNVYFAGADFSRYGFSVHNGYANAKKIAAQIIREIRCSQ
jgi:monoamine oxidase